MRNKILLTALLAIIGLFTFSTTADAHRGNRGHRHGQHKHVVNQRGRTVIIWHNNNQRCNFRNNGFNQGNRMCNHMRGMMNNRACGNQVIRCNHRGCVMFGQRYNGRNDNQWGYNDGGRNGNGRGGNGRGGNGRGGNGRNGNGGRR